MLRCLFRQHVNQILICLRLKKKQYMAAIRTKVMEDKGKKEVIRKVGVSFDVV